MGLEDYQGIMSVWSRKTEESPNTKVLAFQVNNELTDYVNKTERHRDKISHVRSKHRETITTNHTGLYPYM